MSVLRSLPRTSGRLLALLLLPLLLSVPVAGAYDSDRRLLRAVFDFDANGVPDAEEVYSYDATGFVTSATYSYTGDGTADLLVTRDDDAVTEATTATFDAQGRLTSLVVDRGTEAFATALTFAGDSLARVDLESRDGTGAVLDAQYWLFTYDGGALTEVDAFTTSGDVFLNRLTLTYGADALPETVVLDSPGIDASTTFLWDDAGRATRFTQVIGGGFGGGAAVYSYDAAGRLTSESWSVDGLLGSFYAPVQGVADRKRNEYDADGLRTRERYDAGDDGTDEALITLEWEAGPCRPGFLWAPNGTPNFVRMPGLPFVPGTGATRLEYCGPTSVGAGAPAVVPVPAPILGAGALAFAMLGNGILRRASRRRARGPAGGPAA